MSLIDYQQKYIVAIRHARAAGEQAFQRWFNREASNDVSQAMIRGAWDFTTHILTPRVCAHFANPEAKIALEIGYGGGRLINTAALYFAEVIGIDIHAEHETVTAFLQAQGRQNVRLMQTDGASIPVASQSVDFIYSFIVLQHLPSYHLFVRYIAEVARCLRCGGIAQLYFGKFSRLHPVHQILYAWQGYRAVADRPVNHISLSIRRSRVKQLCRSYGFNILATGSSYYRVPDGYPNTKGGQHYITLLKTTYIG